MVDLDDAQLTWESLGTFLQSDHQLQAYIKKENHLKSESSRVQKDLQAEVDCLQEKTIEADHLLEEKTAKVRVLQEALRNGELILAGSQATLALEEERRKKIEGYELYEDRVARKFSKLDLNFLYGDIFDEETGPSAIVADPCPIEAALEPFEPTIKASEPMLEPEVVPEALGSPAAPPFESVEPAVRSVTTTGVSSFSPISPPEIGGS
ncbi:hypothetical protein COCNU_scaffold004313G000010 [Cocos nucifera]|nr:hypothetical protein [Cocos nucifera]